MTFTARSAWTLCRARSNAFRIGHLGDFNDLMLAGTLCGVEMGLAIAGVHSGAAADQVAVASLALHSSAAAHPVCP